MNACALGRAKLAQYVASLAPSSGFAKAGMLVKAGYLASVTGLERNVLSNTLFGVGVQDLAVQPVALALDHLQAYARSAATFGKIKPHELRTLASSLDVGGIKAVSKGVREGVADAVQLLRTGVDAGAVNAKFDLNETSFKNPALNAAVHGVFNVLEASDKPFFGYAFQRSRYQRAKLVGIRAGFTGDALTAETNKWLANPTDGMILGAMDDANYATYKNKTVLGEAAAGMRHRIEQRAGTETAGKRLGYKAGALGMDVMLPFTKVGSSIVMATTDFAFPGTASVKTALQAMLDKDPNANGIHVTAAAKGVASAGLIAAGMALYKSGNISLDANTPSERAQQQAEGKQDFAIKVNGRWRTIGWLGPMIPPVLLGAFLAKHADDKKKGGTPMTGLEQAAGAAAFTGKVLTEAAYLQSVRKIIDAMSGGANAGRSLIGAVTPVPSIVGQIRTAADPTQRVTSTQGDMAKNATPGLSRTLPPKADSYGRDVPRRAPGFRGVVETFLDPSRPTTDRTTNAMAEMDRLNVLPGNAPASVRVGGRVESRTPADRAAMQRDYGPALLERLDALVASPDYGRANDDSKTRMLRGLIRNSKAAATGRDRLRRMTP